MVCPKLMWLFKQKQDSELQNWVKQHLTFLVSDIEKMFQSNFSYQEGKPVASEIEMRAVNGIWFEDQIFKYFCQKKKVYSFEDKFQRSDSAMIKHNLTKRIIASRKFDVYYQPYFRYQHYVTKCDLLFDYGSQGFDLYEVKAVNKINTKKRKEEFTNDLLYQCWILDKLGYRIRNVYILHLDEKYSFKEKLNVAQLFKVNETFSAKIHTEITQNKETKHLDEILAKAWTYLQTDFEEMQIKLIDYHCPEKKNSCTQILKKIKSKYNWLQLYRLRREKKVKFYLENLGNEIDLENIRLENFELTQKQLRSVRVVQNLENIIKEKDKVVEQLKRYQSPVYFYDFETISLAIPRFDGAHPWMQIPFQYSMHILIKENDQTKIDHLDYLSENRTDPRKEFIRQFLQDIDHYGPGTYVAYNVTFEKMILKNLLESIEWTEKERVQIQNIIDQTIDLMDFFQNFNIYHKNFFGSLSIKKTLPALVPKFESSYQQLKIQKGDQASAFYFNYLYELIDQQTWTENAQHLRQYCELDSLAMLKIYEKIVTMVQELDS